MKLVQFHLTGNANVKAAAYGFAEANLLTELHVSIASFPDSILDKLANVQAFSEIKRRSFDPILKPYIYTWPWLEIGRMMAQKIGLSSLYQKESSPFYIDAVCKNFDKRVASRLGASLQKGVSAIYSYEDLAKNSFTEAKRLGLKCFYDLPIGYWRSAQDLLEKERENWPEWKATLTNFNDSPEKLRQKDEELKMADQIFVASSFTANTLKNYPGTLAPVHVIPYGFPKVYNMNRKYSNTLKRKALKLLFVGSLSQRKGIANLFFVVDELKKYVTLTVVGNKTVAFCPALDVELAKHKWIPSLSNDKILELMREHDVLVFPSLFEGFGLVITEAMSQGTPVITTERTAGPDLIEHGEDGWIVEAGSTQHLKHIIESILYRPEIIEAVGRAAMEKADRRPWLAYGRELSETIKSL